MKPGAKLAILLISFVAFWGAAAGFYCYATSPKRNAGNVAKKALLATVDKPESVKVLGISKPDSVYGRSYINDNEKLVIAQSMMKVNQVVMERTNDFDNLDFDDPATTALMERQMSVMSVMRSLVNLSDPTGKAPKGPFNGWKVKIEYQAKDASGSLYHSEYWAILDKDATCVVNSFEIPIL